MRCALAAASALLPPRRSQQCLGLHCRAGADGGALLLLQFQNLEKLEYLGINKGKLESHLSQAQSLSSTSASMACLIVCSTCRPH
jgi:hypothetical protein